MGLDHDMWVHLRAYPCPDKCSGIHRSEYEMIDDQQKTAPVCMNGSGFWWFLAGKWSKLLKPYESKRAQKNPLKSQPSTVWQQAAIRWKRLPQNRGGAWPRSDFSIGWLVHPRNYATQVQCQLDHLFQTLQRRSKGAKSKQNSSEASATSANLAAKWPS